MKVVWTNGCFDILHRGHIELFKYASSLGDYLVVGVDSDKKVKDDKGPERPFNNIEDRLVVLSAIRYINESVVFHSQKGLELLIRQLKPSYLVVGSDWKGKNVVGAEFAKEVKFFDRLEGHSTTRILDHKGNQNVK